MKKENYFIKNIFFISLWSFFVFFNLFLNPAFAASPVKEKSERPKSSIYQKIRLPPVPKKILRDIVKPPQNPSPPSVGLPKAQESYLDLAAHYAPVFYQDVDNSSTKAEYITNFNFDNDWIGNNNWEHLDSFPLLGYIYYSVVETPTHWFIIYGDFHPRDWDDLCTTINCHENDFEGVQVAVKKNGTTYGELLLVSTEAHNVLHLYSNHPDVSGRSKSVEGPVPVDGSHPKISIESKGHGVYVNIPVTGGDGFSNGNFPGGDGIVYRYTGTASQPVNGNDRNVSYALLSLRDDLWSRRLGPNDTYTDYFKYNGARLDSSMESIGGAFIGDDFNDNQAKPPWAWDDSSDGNVNNGDWAIDPAWTFSQQATIASAYSLDYIDNFYLSPLGKVISADQSNAAQYFTLRSAGPFGTKSNCEDNNYNQWCQEKGVNHWPQNMIGCYEVSDDKGSDDCRYDSAHASFMTYAWNKQTFPYKMAQIDHITVRTLTKRDVCYASGNGWENDDGWKYNSAGGYILSMTLQPNMGWKAQYCESGSSGGPYQLTAGFGNDGFLDTIEVRAGDHNDEGAFQILAVDVMLKSFCADGTPIGSCNASHQYCNENSQLAANSVVCGDNKKYIDEPPSQ